MEREREKKEREDKQKEKSSSSPFLSAWRVVLARAHTVSLHTLFIITRLLFIVPHDPVDMSDKVGSRTLRYCGDNYLMTTK